MNYIRFFALKAGLGLNKGTIFGPGGEYHLRLNVACLLSFFQRNKKQPSGGGYESIS